MFIIRVITVFYKGGSIKIIFGTRLQSKGDDHSPDQHNDALLIHKNNANNCPHTSRIHTGCILHRNTIDMAGVEIRVIVADRGFYSSDNVQRLKKNHLSLIVPLRRIRHSYPMRRTSRVLSSMTENN